MTHRTGTLPRNRTELTMTTHARKRLTNWKRMDILRCATWNVRSLNNKEQELILELEDHNIDIFDRN